MPFRPIAPGSREPAATSTPPPRCRQSIPPWPPSRPPFPSKQPQPRPPARHSQRCPPQSPARRTADTADAGQSWLGAYSWAGMSSSLAVARMWYRAAADLVVVVHLLFISFVVGGAFLTWHWPKIIWVHIPAAAYGAL